MIIGYGEVENELFLWSFIKGCINFLINVLGQLLKQRIYVGCLFALRKMTLYSS